MPVDAAQSSSVRIFLSSTFTDTQLERNLLIRDGYPILTEVCRILGWDFEVVDMRWGIPDHQVHSNATEDICLTEIERCFKVSAGPAFVSILGNKYGYRPIPSKIPSPEFTQLLQSIDPLRGGDLNFLKSAYQLDENNVPPVYVLRPAYADNISEEEKEKQLDVWNKKFVPTVQRILWAATEEVLGQEQSSRYTASITHKEVELGLLLSATCGGSKSRELDDIDEVPVEDLPPKDVSTLSRYVDITQKSKDDYAEFLLRQLKRRVTYDAQYVVPFSHSSIPSWEPSPSDPLLFANADYIEHAEQFVREVVELIAQGILDAYEHRVIMGGERDPVFEEVVRHARVARERIEGVAGSGREEVVADVVKWVRREVGDGEKPFLITAPSGYGKADVIAKTIQQLSTSRPSMAVVYRFIGSTAESADPERLIQSLCRQIGRIYGDERWEAPGVFDEEDLAENFRRALKMSHIDLKLVVLLDSIHQLGEAADLFWIPENVPPHTTLILTTNDLSHSAETLSFRLSADTDNTLTLPPLTEADITAMLTTLQSKSNRTLTPAQRTLFIQKCLKERSPLFVQGLWGSFKKLRGVVDAEMLAPLVPDELAAIAVVRMMDVESLFGKEIVTWVLGVFTACERRGISDREILEVLGGMEGVLDAVFKYWSEPLRRFPIVIWIRIKDTLKEYIVERSDGGAVKYFWCHAQFREWAVKKYLPHHEDPCSLSTHRTTIIHSALATYFATGSLPKLPTQYRTDATTQLHLAEWFSLGISQFSTSMDPTSKPGGGLADIDAHFYWARQSASNGNADGMALLGICYKYEIGTEENHQQAAKWFSKSANMGSNTGEFWMGLSFFEGEGVRKDSKQACMWFEKAVRGGNPNAMMWLGLAYENGNGVREDKKRAVELFTTAAGMGQTMAQYMLGCAYREGSGVAKDVKRAFGLWKRAAMKGDAMSQMALGRAYFNGTDVERDVERAIMWFRQAAEGEDEEGAIALTQAYAAVGKGDKNAKRGAIWTKRAAEAGNSEAIVALSHLQSQGLGVEKDPAKSIAMLLPEAEKGNVQAQCNLGVHYFEGSGVPQDYAKAKMWFERAATGPVEKRSAMAMHALGVIYHRGWGVERDDRVAIKYFQEAADKGGKEGQFNVGFFYTQGLGGLQKDEKKGADWYQKAAEQGLAAAQYSYGNCFYNGRGRPLDRAIAAMWFRKSAEGGNANGQNNYGVCLREGHGVPADQFAAVEWFRKAAEQGDLSGMSQYAAHLRDGRGVPKDLEASAELFLKCAEAGDALSQFNVACLLMKGDVLEQDKGKAVYWCRKAAEQGQAHAMNNLGNYLREGKGIEKDEVEAFKWTMKSAEKGIAVAMSTIADCYRDGVGVGKDRAQAIKWYKEAVTKGHVPSLTKLAQLVGAEHLLEPTTTTAPSLPPPYTPTPLEADAESGDPVAQYNLALRLSRGEDGYTKNERKAFELMLKSATTGLVQAKSAVGMMYMEGMGCERNLQEAAKWHSKAAEGGILESQNTLGIMYNKGLGVPRNEKEAFKWVHAAASKGHLGAMANLGTFYCEGCGVPPDNEMAAVWFRQAADEGNAQSSWNLGLLMRQGKLAGDVDVGEMLRLMRSGAEGGVADAQYELGLLYSGSDPRVAPNSGLSMKYFIQAAAQKHTLALIALGDAYVAKGPSNRAQGIAMYEQAAKQVHNYTATSATTDMNVYVPLGIGCDVSCTANPCDETEIPRTCDTKPDNCFPGYATLMMHDGEVYMRDVKVGDVVEVIGKDGKKIWDEVVYVYRSKRRSGVFSVLEYVGEGGERGEFHLTPSHVLPVSTTATSPRSFMQAKDVLRHTYIHHISHGPVLVTGISQRLIKNAGQYAPITRTASSLLIVDGIIASPWAVDHDWLELLMGPIARSAYAILKPMNLHFTVLNSDWIAYVNDLIGPSIMRAIQFAPFAKA
ncbi:hypothetical protein HDV00_007227 [Rhizophlyctis rosea]|nr:hypothetical protein HDV00_007227 [Rhizophlyctis rosea]